jgi:hypothetical protein
VGNFWKGFGGQIGMHANRALSVFIAIRIICERAEKAFRNGIFSRLFHQFPLFPLLPTAFKPVTVKARGYRKAR